jgi:hypothetical protein
MTMGQIKPRHVRTIPISANSDGLDLVAVNETSRATGSRWGGVQVIGVLKLIRPPRKSQRSAGWNWN